MSPLAEEIYIALYRLGKPSRIREIVFMINCCGNYGRAVNSNSVYRSITYEWEKYYNCVFYTKDTKSPKKYWIDPLYYVPGGRIIGP